MLSVRPSRPRHPPPPPPPPPQPPSHPQLLTPPPPSLPYPHPRTLIPTQPATPPPTHLLPRALIPTQPTAPPPVHLLPHSPYLDLSDVDRVEDIAQPVDEVGGAEDSGEQQIGEGGEEAACMESGYESEDSREERIEYLKSTGMSHAEIIARMVCEREPAEADSPELDDWFGELESRWPRNDTHELAGDGEPADKGKVKPSSSRKRKLQ